MDRQKSLRRRIPAITKIAKGGLIVEGDGWAIPWKITLGFYDRARALGAKFLAPVKINRIERYCDHWQLKTDFGTVETDCIVNCAGAWGGRIAKMVGDNLPIEAHAPMLAVTDQQPMFLNSVIGVMGATLSLKQLQNGTIIIGGGIRGKAPTRKK